MQYGASYTTASNVVFTQDHPFQLVQDWEVADLLTDGRFRRAGGEEMMEYYGG